MVVIASDKQSQEPFESRKLFETREREELCLHPARKEYGGDSLHSQH